LDGLAGDVADKQYDMLTRALAKIQALGDLSTELLDLAKIESGLITQEREKVNMSELLTEQVAFYQEVAGGKKSRLLLEVLPDLPPVLVNRQNMDEVISNLISNAISYTPEGGEITVSASVENNYLCIRVKDNGIGICEDDLDRIFDRFYRVKDEKTRYITGTGLGLPIVKSIVEAHNGRLNVESEPEKGSTFFVYIPLITASEH